MAVNFPSDPQPNQTYVYGDRSWLYTGTYWRSTSLGNFGSLTVSGDTILNGALIANGSPGTNGQVLTSTGYGLAWAAGGTGGGGGGGTSNVPIKTFNIIGDFGTLVGTARFYPPTQDTIKSVILSTATIIQSNLILGLYRNNEFVQFFTINAGTGYAKYTGLNYIIQTSESYTVNVVAGSGTNLAMALFNIDL